MSGFDIASLHEFKPPRYFCRKCFALNCIQMIELKVSCKVCGCLYLGTDEYRAWQLVEYLNSQGFGISFENLIEHSKDLGEIAKQLRTNRKYYPPFRALFDAVLRAEHFIHFTTYGLSHLILGALKLVEGKNGIKVRGVISNVDEMLAKELSAEYQKEAPSLETFVFAKTSREDADGIPHQKVVIIDGLLAFEGSTNLTNSGLRKAADGLDRFEPITDVERVKALNNEYFSTIWKRKTDWTEVTMSEHYPPPDDIPF